MQRLRIIYFSLLFVITAMVITSIANAETIIVPNQNLDVVIDVDACDLAGHVLCGGTGSSGAAAVGNDSIVVVFVYARTANGLPITGLAEGDFSFTALQNPGGISLVFVQTGICPACFAEFPDGVYRFAMRPVSGNWDDGTYIQALQVTSGANTRQVVVPVQVPN